MIVISIEDGYVIVNGLLPLTKHKVSLTVSYKDGYEREQSVEFEHTGKSCTLLQSTVLFFTCINYITCK